MTPGVPKPNPDPINTTRVGLEGVGWPHMAPDVPKDGQNPIRTFLRASNPDPISTPRTTPGVTKPNPDPINTTSVGLEGVGWPHASQRMAKIPYRPS